MGSRKPFRCAVSWFSLAGSFYPLQVRESGLVHPFNSLPVSSGQSVSGWLCQRLLLYCRAGFEKECVAEMTAMAKGHGMAGSAQGEPGGAVVIFTPHDPSQWEGWSRLRLADLIFARQLIHGACHLPDLPREDRLAQLIPAIRQLGTAFGGLRLETADTNEAKVLATFCRKFTPPLCQALDRAGIVWNQPDGPTLHLFFPSATAVHVGWSEPAHASPWPQGIPRLKLAGDAPSRSILKIEEAMLTMLSPEERAITLRAGRSAVDLGAAPGGWTWYLAGRGLRVIAVDNGPLAPLVRQSKLVSHLRQDGFRYRRSRPVDWLVCDMVEQPARIAELVGSWLREGWCRHALFNWKLPMKQRYQEVQRCRVVLQTALKGVKGSPRIRLKQLYHDREEVTGVVLT